MAEKELIEFARNCTKEDRELYNKALDESIKHWIGIKQGNEVENGEQTCPLCKFIFNTSYAYTADCKKCPISIYTDLNGCNDTPYIKWRKHFREDHPLYKGERRVLCKECVKIASEEIYFLEKIKHIFCKGKKYYLKIKNPGVAIGDGEIYINVVDLNGNHVPGGYLIRLEQSGIFAREECVSDKIDCIKLDENGRIKITD